MNFSAAALPMLSLPVLMPLALCWPFLSMGVLAACPPASVRAAATGLSAIGLALAVLAAVSRSVWPATPFVVPPGPLGLLLPLPALALFVASLSGDAAAAGGATPRRGAVVLTHGLAGGAVVATACADPLSGAVAVGGVAMLAALTTAVTRGAARAGWDLFRLSLSGILLAVPGATLLAASDAAGRLDELGGLLLTIGLGTVAGLGPAAPVVLAAGDAVAPVALAPVVTSIPVLRHLAVGPERMGVMVLGVATLWLMALSIRVAPAARRGRLSVGLVVGLAAVAAGAGGDAGQVGLAALLLSAALLAPLARQGGAADWNGLWGGGLAPLVRSPFLPFGGLVLTLAALCDAAPLLVLPVAVGVAMGSPMPMGGAASALRPGRLGRGVAALLLAGLVILVLRVWR